MSPRRSRSGWATAQELRRDPEFVAREREQRRIRVSNVAQYDRAAALVLADLDDAGYPVTSVGELRQRGFRYPGAIPVLVKWLSKVVYRPLKEDIVRTLSVPWAKPVATPVLIDQFRTQPKAEDPAGTGLQWAIGNALEVLADKHVLEDLIEISGDRRYGVARQMVVLGLARPKDPRAIPILISLLDDEDVAGHAAMALGRLRAQEARGALEELFEHGSKPWFRREAKKALAKLNKPR
jgi:hypothetical protein